MISGDSLVNLFIATTLCLEETIVCTNKVISEGGTFDVVRETQTNLGQNRRTLSIICGTFDEQRHSQSGHVCPNAFKRQQGNKGIWINP